MSHELMKEQRIIIKFLVKSEKKGNEIIQMLKNVYGDQTMSQSAAYEWIKRFKDGREDVNDDEGRGRHVETRTPSNVERVRDFVNSDRRLSIRDVADVLNINRETVRLIIKDDLNMRKLCAKLVPKNLSAEQKQRRVDVCRDWLEAIEADESVLGRIITCDESWIFEYDPETKRQSMQWVGEGEPRPKKARMSKSQLKTMLIIFFDQNGIIHKEFLPQRTTINADRYLEILKRLHERIRRVRPDLWADKSWLFHQDNAPVHTAMKIRNFFAKNQVNVIDHPPYSPDLAPCDFFLFPRLKHALKGHRFEGVDAIQRATTEALRAITLDQFQGCFKQWKHRMQKCIYSEGNYFEGDTLDVPDN